MNTEIIPLEQKDQLARKLNVTLTSVQRIKHIASQLTVNGVKDYKGLRTVTKARKTLKDYRLAINDKRKELNADILKQMRDTNYVAKLLINELKPEEVRLRNIEKEIANEKLRIKLEKKRQELERLQSRINQLTAYECAYDIDEVQKATDEQFSLMLDKAKFNYEAAQQLKRDQAKRLAEENEKLKQENEQLKQSVAANVVSQPMQVIEIHPPENFVEPHIVETTNHVDVPEQGLSEQEKEEIKMLVKNYALAVQAVPVPDIKDTQALLVFNNAYNQISAGVNMLLRAVE